MILYTKNNCPHCDDAKKYLNRLEGVSFEERNVEENRQHLIEFLKLTQKLNTTNEVPLFTNGKQYVQGFDAKEYLPLIRYVDNSRLDWHPLDDIVE